MSVNHFVDRPHDLVVTTFSERVTLDEIASACTKLRDDHDFRAHYHQLADLTMVSHLDLAHEDLRVIRATYDPFSTKSRRAFVASDRDTIGKVVAYQVITASDQFGVFPSLLDAISWLGLEVTVLQAKWMDPSFRKHHGAKSGACFHLPASTPRTFRRTDKPAKAHRSGH